MLQKYVEEVRMLRKYVEEVRMLQKYIEEVRMLQRYVSIRWLLVKFPCRVCHELYIISLTKGCTNQRLAFFFKS